MPTMDDDEKLIADMRLAGNVLTVRGLSTEAIERGIARLSALKAERDAHEAAGRRLADAAIAEVARAEKAEAERDRMAAALRALHDFAVEFWFCDDGTDSAREQQAINAARAALSQEPTPHRS